MRAALRSIRSLDPWTLRFGLIALVAAGFAFVGLSTGGFWIDELYTVHLIDHRGGVGEVLRRSLTDTQPPGYYLLLWAWTRLAGVSETSVRLLSALCGVAALAVLGWGLRRVFRPAAVAFALAVAACSMGWFMHVQNGRNYALSLLVSAALLSLAVAWRRRRQAGRPAGLALAGLVVVGLLGSFCHAYLLLGTGMVLGWLLLGAWRDRRTAAALIGSGALILALNIAYLHLLARSSRQDLHDLWFGNDPTALRLMLSSAGGMTIPETALLAIGVLVVAGLVRRPQASAAGVGAADQAWTAGLCAATLLGVTGAGLLVSFTLAPSFSNRNLFTAAPFAWGLLAWLYDRAGPRGRGARETLLGGVLVVLVGANLALLVGRFRPLTEPWRASARYVQSFAGCVGRPIPVVYPLQFGPADAGFRALAEQAFYGRYLGRGGRPVAVLPSELAGRRRLAGLQALLSARSTDVGPGGCPVLAWGVHDLTEAGAIEIGEDLLRSPGFRGSRLQVQAFVDYRRALLTWRPRPTAWVFLAAPAPPPPGGRLALPSLAPHADPAAIDAGDRLVLEHLYAFAGRSGPPYAVDGYGLQRWRAGVLRSESFPVARRFACDPPTPRSKAAVWPDLRLPGCSARPLGADDPPVAP